jgi:lipopolysaccharide export system protein LptA
VRGENIVYDVRQGDFRISKQVPKPQTVEVLKNVPLRLPPPAPDLQGYDLKSDILKYGDDVVLATGHVIAQKGDLRIQSDVAHLSKVGNTVVSIEFSGNVQVMRGLDIMRAEVFTLDLRSGAFSVTSPQKQGALPQSNVIRAAWQGTGEITRAPTPTDAKAATRYDVALLTMRMHFAMDMNKRLIEKFKKDPRPAPQIRTAMKITPASAGMVEGTLNIYDDSEGGKLLDTVRLTLPGSLPTACKMVTDSQLIERAPPRPDEDMLKVRALGNGADICAGGLPAQYY